MITVRHLRKEYPGVTPLKDVSVEIGKGEVISIIGPSGTGKSTLLRCINLLEKPTSGEILIKGQAITDPKCKVHLLRRKMGMVFQSFNLFNHMTIIENIMAGPVSLLGKSRQEAYDKGMELLRTVGLGDKALSYPDELSGGQKQRAAIARTLISNTPIMIFDDSLSAVDTETDAQIRKAIEKRFGKASVILISHRITTLSAADKIIVLDRGRIAEEGTHESLKSAGGIYQKIYEAQSGIGEVNA